MSRPPATGRESQFFVGYLPTPRPLVAFLAVVTVVALGLGIGAGIAIVLAQQDHGAGRFLPGQQTLRGIVQTDPYPVLRMPGSTVVLAGLGKRGVQSRAARLAGKPVQLGGRFLGRDAGAANLLQVGGRVKFRELEDPGDLAQWTPAPDRVLGTFRLKGEIVDSKCYLGAMRPGRGKVHLACASLCIMGGIPPMFVVHGEQQPPELLLLAGPDGGPVPREVLAQVALYVELEGELLARDDLLIFRVDPASLRVP
ncbi:MAG: hypothetical protein OXE86_01680 [Alphaproteobacteria bacterium]|nr:hypothetical protein [Alphaproteobacteria bacterium]